MAYRAPDPEVVSSSTAGNAYGFQARDRDPTTGWIYLRNRWYDPELGRFVSPDPLGYADGPNRLAYAGNNPVNRGDPLGLYATDFHYGVTMYLGLQFGLRPEDAVRIAAGAQMPDADSRQPIPSAVLGALGSEANRMQVVDWHFPTSEPHGAGEVTRGSTEAWAKAHAGIDSGNLIAFSEGLHPLQDSWSHAGTPSLSNTKSVSGIERVVAPGSGIAWFTWPTRTPVRRPDGGHPKGANLETALHVPFMSTRADDPSERKDDAIAAARATYEALAMFAARNPNRLPLLRTARPWSLVAMELEQLFSIKSKAGRVAWLRARGVVLP